MPIDHTTNELEFQGNVIIWVNSELTRKPGMGLELITQEPSKLDRRRNDLVIWRNRASHDAFFTLELKTPETAITDPILLNDACQKAQKWNAPFFAIWNMQSAEIFRTPQNNKLATPKDCLVQFPPLSSVTSVGDWINIETRKHLHDRALDLLNTVWNIAIKQGVQFPIDASLFVDRLTHRIKELKNEVQPELTQRATRSRALRKQLVHIAAAQGFLGFVEDINVAISGQYCYRIVGQILFYFALRRKQPSLHALNPDKTMPFHDAVRPYWDNVRRFDYQALFESHEYDQIIPLTKHAEELLYDLIDEFNKYDWNTLKDDVLGSIFEHLIPKHEQTLLGQFYTRSSVADLLIVLALDGDKPKLLDPGCGTGTFLLRGYQYLLEKQNLSHSQLLSLIWGFDISPFASELSVINLFRQNLSEFDNFPRILCGDFFQRSIGDQVNFPPAQAGIQEKVTLTIPFFDAIIANPPYLRSQQQDDLDPKYKSHLFSLVAREHSIEAPAKTDLFAFFVYHSHKLLRSGGRLAFVTSASWLTSDYGYFLQRFMLEKFRLIAIITSEVESFFTQVDQNTVLFVAEKRKEHEECKIDELINFVKLKKRLNELFPSAPSYWKKIEEFADFIENSQNHYEDEKVRIRCVPLSIELNILKEKIEVRNWSIPLRAPSIYFTLTETEGGNFVPIEDLADCNLGYKSLQNQFYYLSNKTVDEFALEDEFLKPIYLMEDLDSNAYNQINEPATLLFNCNNPLVDIRGSGAYKYIMYMDNIPASKKKQGGPIITISEALEKQSGLLWYAPKATPREANIWIRKAFDGTYSPFIFEKAKIVDQRCNCITPKFGLDWKVLAGVLTSSFIALSIEAAGSTSMGAGALEIPTTKLSRILIPDIRKLSHKKRQKLINLAYSVWSKNKPLNWKDSSCNPSLELRNLDNFIIKEFNLNITLEDLYDGIRQTLKARISLAKDKALTKKSSESIDISSVAQSILKSLKPRLEEIRFPESFIHKNVDMITIDIDSGKGLEVHIEPFMEITGVRILSFDNDEILNTTLERPISEVLVRALLIGRRHFSIPKDREIALQIIRDFWKWFPPLLEEIKSECSSSSVGTRFEGEIFKLAMNMLNWSERLTQEEIVGHFRIMPIKISN